MYLLGKKLIKSEFLPGGIVKQYGSNQEGKIDQWMIVYTVRVAAAISAQRFSSCSNRCTHSQDPRQIQTENKAPKQKRGGSNEPPCFDE